MTEKDDEKLHDAMFDFLTQLKRHLEPDQKFSRHSVILSGSPQAPTFDVSASEASSDKK